MVLVPHTDGGGDAEMRDASVSAETPGPKANAMVNVNPLAEMNPIA